MKPQIFAAGKARRIAHANAMTASGSLDGDRAEDMRFGMLRLAASRACPCSRSELTGVAATALRGILPPEAATVAELDSAVDALVGSGDLIVGSTVLDGVAQVRLYLAPPMYVRRRSGAVFIMGGLAELPIPFGDHVHARGPYRELAPAPSEHDLAVAGLSPFPIEAWRETPTARSSAELVAQLDDRLDQVGNSGDLADLEVLDPEARPEYYVGRWASPERKSGRFVARRRNKWGGRLWGYVELVNGQTLKWVRFPTIDRRFRACDEAWWAICALDAHRASPQKLAISQLDGLVRLAVSQPLPAWAERRMMTVGDYAASRPKGSILAFDLRASDSDEEIEFLVKSLWLEPNHLAGADIG